MARLTKKRVERIQPGARDRWAWDSELPGFGVRVLPSGRRCYVIQYRTGRRTRRLTLGQHGVLTCEEARERARALLAKVKAGGDPAEARRRQARALTVQQFAELYLERHAKPHKKPGSVEGDERMLARYVLPRLGRRKMADVKRADIERLHHAMRRTPFAANRVLAMCSVMMNLAERWGVRPDGTNPCRHVTRYKERRRERYLTPDELQRLGEVLREVERERVELPAVVPALRLLMLTGARRGEILSLRWEYVDLDRRCLRLADSKTGAKEIQLNGPALQVLADLPHLKRNPWVIPGRKPGAHMVNLSKPWHRIRKRAGLEDVRLHDLRHTYASYGAGLRASLPIIGALLGHTQASTTARYAHLAADPLQRAAEQIGGRIAALLDPPDKTADVVPIEHGRKRR